MNYKQHYERLIARAKERTLDGYFEKHHIVPRCLGGSDEIENMANLTPEEHFVAHQLLLKMYPGHRGLAYALVCLSGKRSSARNVNSNKLYGWIRRKASESRKGYKMSDETKAKMSAAKRRDSEKIRQQRLGSKLSEETKQKMRGKRAFVAKPLISELKWINNGVDNRRTSSDVPEGWTLGRIKWSKKRDKS